MCSRSLNKLAQPLPMAHCANSRLVCKISGDVMNENNPPMMLPNGYVYGYNVRGGAEGRCWGGAWRGGPGRGWEEEGPWRRRSLGRGVGKGQGGGGGREGGRALEGGSGSGGAGPGGAAGGSRWRWKWEAGGLEGPRGGGAPGLPPALRQVLCLRCGRLGPALPPEKAAGSGVRGQGSRGAELSRSRRWWARPSTCSHAHVRPVVFQSLLSIRQDDKVVCPRTKEVFHFSQAEKVYIM